jgi:hypothetical protein
MTTGPGRFARSRSSGGRCGGDCLPAGAGLLTWRRRRARRASARQGAAGRRPRPPHRSGTCPCRASSRTPSPRMPPGYAMSTDEVLCRIPRGLLLRRGRYNREIWKPAIEAAGLPASTTFHDLRHTFASTALAGSVPISEVSRWLGHKSITTTIDLYGHLVPEASGRARDALDKAFQGEGEAL